MGVYPWFSNVTT